VVKDFLLPRYVKKYLHIQDLTAILESLARLLKMKVLFSYKISGTNCPLTQHAIPEE
jgi:hypothetical protein